MVSESDTDTKFLLSPGEPSPTHGTERDILIQKKKGCQLPLTSFLLFR